MEKLIAEKYVEDHPEVMNKFILWGDIDKSITKFQIYADLKIFEFIFGNDGERLWRNFVNECNRNFYEFRTYLRREQWNDLMVNLYCNKDIYSIV